MHIQVYPRYILGIRLCITVYFGWNDVHTTQAKKSLMKFILGAGCQCIEVWILHPCVCRKQFMFPFSLCITNLHMGAEGAFRAGDQYTEQLRCLPALKIERKKFYLQGCGSCSSDEPERLDWKFIAMKLNSELSVSSDQKQQTDDKKKLPSGQFGTGI